LICLLTLFIVVCCSLLHLVIYVVYLFVVVVVVLQLLTYVDCVVRIDTLQRCFVVTTDFILLLRLLVCYVLR